MPSDSDSFLMAHEAEDTASSYEWGERLRRLYFNSKRLLAAWWWIILLTIAAGIGLQAYKELNREPIFISHGKMMVSGRFALPDNVYREELSNFFGTQISLMQSDRVQRLAKERVVMLHPDIKRSWVNLSVIQSPEASIFLLRAEGGKPEFTQKFLDAVMEEYQTFRREMRSDTTESTLMAVTEQLYRLEAEIEAQENTFVDFQKKNNLVFLKEQESSAGAYLAKLTNQQAELKTQLLILENLKIDDVGSLASTQSPLIEADSLALLNETRLRRKQLKAELEEFSIHLKPKHPKIIDLELNIDRADNLMDILDRQTVQSLDERKEQLKRQINNLDAVIAQWEAQALAISRKSAEFERLQYRLERSRNTYQQLLDSTQAIQSNQNIEQETVGILAPASKAAVRPPQVTKKVTEGAVTGMLAGIAIIAGIGFFDVRIRSSEDLLKQVDFPLVGLIPEEEKNESGQIDLLEAKDRRHRFAESCRNLRSMILLHDSEESKESGRCLVLSSATPSEGKSTISANLAVTLSLTGKRVLLVDADMRQGSIHKLFSLTGENGLSDMLGQTDEFDSYIKTTKYENLDLISNGTRISNPGELLMKDRTDDFLTWAKQHYAYIILDAPPVLAVHDTVELANLADNILFVVRADQTSTRQVRASLERLASRASKILGMVFNCAPAGGIDYYYYYRDYDSYHQGVTDDEPERTKV